MWADNETNVQVTIYCHADVPRENIWKPSGK